VLKNRFMIGAAAATAAVVPFAGMALTGGPAGASAAAKTGITCTKVTGTVISGTTTAKLKLTGCNGNTGGKGKTKGSQGATSGKITWGNAKTTSFSEATSTGTNCAAGNLADELITGNVTADTTGSTATGAAVTAEICAFASGSSIVLSNAPGVPFKIAK
jgi:hypothetical protein